MFFHVVLTDECNLNCSYCYGRAFEEVVDEGDRRFTDVPSEVTYTLENLCAFIRKDPDATVTFYGGEPTLRPELLRKMMDNIPAKRFMMQTNGMLLRGVGAEYMKRMHTILVSVDGRPGLTDRQRGTGVFETVRRNILWLRSQGFSGEFVARMVAIEGTDICEEVRWLLGCGLFDSVHWQLNANFWDDFGKRDFAGWAERSYNPGVKRLAAWWLGEMKMGRVRRIYPFLGVMDLLLKGKAATGILCGAGHHNFAIATDGSIYPCPVLAGLKRFRMGDIRKSHPLELKSRYRLKVCGACGDYGLCGGRCLYGNYMMPWGAGGHELVCVTARNLITSMKAALPGVRKLIEDGTVRQEDLDFVWYNGAEIIP